MKRIIIKVGTKVLTDEDGVLSRQALKRLVAVIAELKKQGYEVILVSSGAMGAGKGLLASKKVLKDVNEKQFFAAVGQAHLMTQYSQLFEEHNLYCAQVLATKEDFRDKVHFLNMRACLDALLHDNVVPIVNENDVVAVRELTFTDNDELAGLLASMLNADSLYILTSVDGLLDMETGKRIKLVTQDEYETHQAKVTVDKTSVGRGGMVSKFAVAQRAAQQGIEVYMVSGVDPSVIFACIAGEDVGTRFVPGKRLTSAKRRLAHAHMEAQGVVQVNECAVDTLQDKAQARSLLPVGVTAVSGSFKKGDVVEIIGPDKQKLGFGVSRFDAKQVQQMLGEQQGKPIIHYDYMFIG